MAFVVVPGMVVVVTLVPEIVAVLTLVAPGMAVFVVVAVVATFPMAVATKKLDYSSRYLIRCYSC